MGGNRRRLEETGARSAINLVVKFQARSTIDLVVKFQVVAECYYLGMLLINVKGPSSFANLRTIDGVECQTYREACQKLYLLENDQNWEITLMDASVSSHPQQIRTLFAIILTTCSPSNPKDLWEKFKEDMSDDILHRIRTVSNDNTIPFSDNIFNEALIKIEDNMLNHQQQNTYSTWHGCTTTFCV